jgi:hypothetical protein
MRHLMRGIPAWTVCDHPSVPRRKYRTKVKALRAFQKTSRFGLLVHRFQYRGKIRTEAFHRIPPEPMQLLNRFDQRVIVNGKHTLE